MKITYTVEKIHFISWHEKGCVRKQFFTSIEQRDQFYQKHKHWKSRWKWSFWTETYKIPQGEL